jgi:stearoyl-CoA desaturase (delta-9 desaturase)
MKRRIDWYALSFLSLTPILAILLWSWHFYENGLSWHNSAMFLFFSVCCAMSITAGYHRLYAHQTYRAKPWVHYILFFFGTASFQGSIMKWATDHRRHHRKIDSEDDPYSITKGFWYAHLGWMLLEDPKEYKGRFEKDLASSKLIAWQHKHYGMLALLFGFGAPTLLGAVLFADPIGGFLYGGLLRTVFNHHTTFLVNSLAHTLGRRTYSQTISARDSWFVALLTYGEGYHNFHHTFEGDYRNGIQWYHFDPTKWILWTLSKIGGVDRLQVTSTHSIFKAKLKNQKGELENLGVTDELFLPALDRVEEALQKWRELSVEYRAKKSDLQNQSREQLKKIKFEMNLARTIFLKRYYFWLSQWRNLRNSLNVSTQRA